MTILDRSDGRASMALRAISLLAIWSVPGLLQCVQEWTYSSAQGVDASVLHVALHFLPTWTPWAAFTPLVLALGRRFPLRRPGLGAAIAIHAAAFVILATCHLLLLAWVRSTFPPAPWAAAEPLVWLRRALWGFTSQVEVLAYVSILIASRARELGRESKQRALRAERLSAQLATARLEALRLQLRPHFLFNTLNTIDVLIEEDPDRAKSVLLRLSSLLRANLDSVESEHSLDRELQIAELYLDIERTRYEGRLEVRYEVPEDLRGSRVPSFVVQPLIENAIRHGIAPRGEGGALTLRASRVGHRLTLEVLDDGVGLPGDFREGIGLVNCRERLATLYGDEGQLTISPADSGGTIARLSLPLKQEPAR